MSSSRKRKKPEILYYKDGSQVSVASDKIFSAGNFFFVGLPNGKLEQVFSSKPKSRKTIAPTIEIGPYPARPQHIDPILPGMKKPFFTTLDNGKTVKICPGSGLPRGYLKFEDGTPLPADVEHTLQDRNYYIKLADNTIEQVFTAAVLNRRVKAKQKKRSDTSQPSELTQFMSSSSTSSIENAESLAALASSLENEICGQKPDDIASELPTASSPDTFDLELQSFIHAMDFLPVGSNEELENLRIEVDELIKQMQREIAAPSPDKTTNTRFYSASQETLFSPKDQQAQNPTEPISNPKKRG